MIRKRNLTPKRRIGHICLLTNAYIFAVFDYVVCAIYNDVKNSLTNTWRHKDDIQINDLAILHVPKRRVLTKTCLSLYK